MAGHGKQPCYCHRPQDNSRRRRSQDARKERHERDCSSSDSEVDASPHVSLYAGLAGCSETGSVRQVGALCGTHTYAVVGYTLARAMGAGTRLCSDLFEVGGQLFRLEVYPAGVSADTHKYLGLFLTTPGTTRPGPLLYELSILDKSASNPQHITERRTAHSPVPAEPAAVLAPRPGVVAGFPKFIKANFLHRNAQRFLPADTLTFRATVKVLTGRSSFPVQPSAQPQLFSIQPNPGLAPHVAPFAAASPYGPPSLGAPAAITDAVQSWSSSIRPQPAACQCGTSPLSYSGGMLPHPAPAGLTYLQQQLAHQGHLAVVPFPTPDPKPAVLPVAQMPYAAAASPAAFAGYGAI